MEAIRIGNDIVVRWDIFRNGAPAELEKIDDLAIVLSCRGEQRRITDYLIEDNTLVFTFYGRDQKKTGAYTLTYIENESRTGMYTKMRWMRSFLWTHLLKQAPMAASAACRRPLSWN